ncbi:MAG TPA: co-chaperone DjlA [bacterium]|nr:co-chaperone DjlA [bacterium]
MSWFGKVLGSALGFFVGGPLGALLGALLGHKFDLETGRALPIGANFAPERGRVQMAFFTATFSVMGHLARADGRVCKAEIAAARSVMDRMALSETMRRTAIDLFTRGKRVDFPLYRAIEQFYDECRRRHALLRIFLEILIESALADGPMNLDEERVLVRICDQLRISRFEFYAMKARKDAAIRFARAYWRSSRSGGYDTPLRKSAPCTEDPYAVLQVSPSASDEEIKRAYRRLMSQHHPDKLLAQGMAEATVRLANEKTQEIRKAYERIRRVRNL